VADLTTKTFAQLVQGQAAAVQARASGLVDVSVGAIVRAVIEAVAGVGLWLQGLILRVAALTRLATSPTDADADSFVADFGAAYSPDLPAAFARQGATFGKGALTFTRFTATGDALVPFGSTVSTADGTQKVVVTIDPTNPAYNSVLGGYVMANTVASVSVPAMALSAGRTGNLVAGTANTITGALPGIDTVTNPLAFGGGLDAETTAAMTVRFRAWIKSLREGTPDACKYAVTALQLGVTCTLVENLNHDGTSNPGFFYVVVDDGSGSPPSSLLTAAALAIDPVRAITSGFGVFAPSIVTVAVAGSVTTAAGADHTAAVTAANAAVSAYINLRAVGEGLSWSRLYQVAYDASPDITDIVGLTLNSGTTDLAITVNQVAKAGTMALT